MCSANFLGLGTACKQVVRVTVGHSANVKRTLVPLNRRLGGQHRRHGLGDLEEREIFYLCQISHPDSTITPPVAWSLY